MWTESISIPLDPSVQSLRWNSLAYSHHLSLSESRWLCLCDGSLIFISSYFILSLSLRDMNETQSLIRSLQATCDAGEHWWPVETSPHGLKRKQSPPSGPPAEQSNGLFLPTASQSNKVQISPTAVPSLSLEPHMMPVSTVIQELKQPRRVPPIKIWSRGALPPTAYYHLL